MTFRVVNSDGYYTFRSDQLDSALWTLQVLHEQRPEIKTVLVVEFDNGTVHELTYSQKVL